MHQCVIKCQPTERPGIFYYAGLLNTETVYWGSVAGQAVPFLNRAEAEKVAKELMQYNLIKNFVVESLSTEDPVMPKLSYEEMLKLGEEVKIPEDNELLGIAIKELDKVIDYLYTETYEQQAFRDLLNVATKLKTLQFNMKEKK